MKVFDETMNKVPRRVEPAQRVAYVRPVDIRDEMAAQLRRRKGRERPRGHGGAEIGAADADVDDVGHRLPERAAHPSLAHVRREAQHLFPCADGLGHHVLAVDENRLAGEIAQGGVKHGALLGDIDLHAGEHRVAPGFDLGHLGELDERA